MRSGSLSLDKAIDSLDVRQVLLDSPLCKSVVESYKSRPERQRFLHDAGRKFMVHALADHLLQLSTEVKNKHFDKVADKIFELFPTESKLTYYVPPKSQENQPKAIGKLYNRYHNRKNKLNELGAGTSRSHTSAVCSLGASDPYTQIASGQGPAFENLDLQQYEAAEQWLKTQVNPWPKVLNFWQLTCPKRLRELVLAAKDEDDAKLVRDYIIKWSVLKNASGYQLLMQDFAFLFPEKENLLFVKWNSFQNKLIALAKRENLQEDVGQMCLQQLESSGISEVNFYIKYWCCSFVGFNGNPPNLIDLAKVQEVVEGHCFNQDKLKERAANCKQKGIRAQPIIIAVGKSLTKVTDYHLSIDSYIYKVNNCLEAIDACFKSFFALHAKYPTESEQLWLLIQRCVYGIECSYANKCLTSFNSCVNHLM
ncbi:hypothetical protein FOCC_FOCC003562 [Frankliniella occidentalis]|nr:hypothetical protein FOCC_FOCC003562 [Frankliniella occidentalis]